MGNAGAFFFIVLLLAGMGGAIYWAYVNSQPGGVSFQVQQDGDEIARAAVHHFTSRGWMTTSQGGGRVSSVTFTKAQSPSCGIMGCLLIFGIIPALIYAAAFKRSLTASVNLSPARDSSGTSVHIAWSRNQGGKGPCLQFAQVIAPAALLNTISQPQLPNP